MATTVTILYVISIINAVIIGFHGFYFDILDDKYIKDDNVIFNIVDVSALVLMFTWVFELIPVIGNCQTVFPYFVFNIIFGTIHYTMIIKSYIYINKHKH